MIPAARFWSSWSFSARFIQCRPIQCNSNRNKAPMDLYTFIKLYWFTNRFILRRIPIPEDAFRITLVRCKSLVRYSSIVTPRHGLVFLTCRNVIAFTDIKLRLSPSELIDPVNIYSVFKMFKVSLFAASQVVKR